MTPAGLALAVIADLIRNRGIHGSRVKPGMTAAGLAFGCHCGLDPQSRSSWIQAWDDSLLALSLHCRSLFAVRAAATIKS
jgi:hypothetical protein